VDVGSVGASLLFAHVLHYPGLDNQVPLLAFLFLVARLDRSGTPTAAHRRRDRLSRGAI
jgi:hypothetical protein